MAYSQREGSSSTVRLELRSDNECSADCHDPNLYMQGREERGEEEGGRGREERREKERGGRGKEENVL